MTTPWVVTREWEGQTVCVIGAGPEMSEELAERARGLKTIVCNRAVRFCSWADVFIGLDPRHPFYADPGDFKGLRVCGVECELDALYAGMWYYTVRISEGHTIEIRNNAIAAIMLAERMGAAKILLLGFDTLRYEEIHRGTGFYGLTQGLKQIIQELRSKGIEVEQFDSENQKPGTRPARRSRV